MYHPSLLPPALTWSSSWIGTTTEWRKTFVRLLTTWNGSLPLTWDWPPQIYMTLWRPTQTNRNCKGTRLGHYCDDDSYWVPCRREALWRWQNNQGLHATYGNLLELFVKAGHMQCAKAICVVLKKKCELINKCKCVAWFLMYSDYYWWPICLAIYSIRI